MNYQIAWRHISDDCNLRMLNRWDNNPRVSERIAQGQLPKLSVSKTGHSHTIYFNVEKVHFGKIVYICFL
jgi:hypothetical protein